MIIEKRLRIEMSLSLVFIGHTKAVESGDKIWVQTNENYQEGPKNPAMSPKILQLNTYPFYLKKIMIDLAQTRLFISLDKLCPLHQPRSMWEHDTKIPKANGASLTRPAMVHSISDVV